MNRYAALGIMLLLSMPLVLAAELPFTRAVYRPSSQVWRRNFSALAEAGIDCYYANGGNCLWSRDRYEEVYGPESLQAAECNITYIAGPYYMQINWDRINFNYTRAVGPSGVRERHTPSPIDETWWYLNVEEPALIIANLSLRYPIWGIVWDMELYGHDAFLPIHYSYDDASLGAFAEDTNATIPFLPTTRRYAWLRDEGILEEYHAWFEARAFQMASSTAEKVHAINPELALGILFFEDAWFYWTILDAFMTPEAPVSGWNEQSYTGFRLGGDEGIDVYRELWGDHGLNGKFLPGLAALDPWELLTHTEACLRYSGALWIYLGNPYPEAYDLPYEIIFKAIENHFFFNQSAMDPVPLFHLDPGIEARGYLAPDGTASLFLTPYRRKEKGTVPIDVVRGFQIVTESDRLTYLGQNLTWKELQASGLHLLPGDIPCIISGLAVDDLVRTEISAMLDELDCLLAYCGQIGFVDLSATAEELEEARSLYLAGRYSESKATLLETRADAYSRITANLWPLVDEGLASPRDSSIALNILRQFSNARGAFNEGQSPKGEAYLYSGLREWSLSVPEICGVIWLASLALGLGLWQRSG